MKTIHAASAEGKVALVKRLVKENKSLINEKDRRHWTPLFYACATGNEELVQFLLKGGANPNVTDNRKRTALHIAVAKKCCGYKKEKVSSKTVKLLLEAEADPNTVDVDENAPLEYLTNWFILQSKWMSKVFCMFLEHGAMLSHGVRAVIFLPFVVMKARPVQKFHYSIKKIRYLKSARWEIRATLLCILLAS